MTLTKMFNNESPARKTQLGLLETALDILQEQKAASHADRSMHGEIAETRRFIWEWGGDTGDGEGAPQRSGPNPFAVDIYEHQAYLKGLRGVLVSSLAESEERLLTVLNKLFDGDKDKLKAFYADVPAFENKKSKLWEEHAAQNFRTPAGVDFDAKVSAKAIAVKFGGRELIESQIATLNALVDDGKLVNKAKRVAWQVMQPRKQAVI